jgi:hypothetical protein
MEMSMDEGLGFDTDPVPTDQFAAADATGMDVGATDPSPDESRLDASMDVGGDDDTDPVPELPGIVEADVAMTADPEPEPDTNETPPGDDQSGSGGEPAPEN